MNLGHNNSSQRSFMGDDMMAMKRCRYISSTEKELFVGTGTTCLVLYSSETHRIQVLHDIEAVYPRAHTMDFVHSHVYDRRCCGNFDLDV